MSSLRRKAPLRSLVAGLSLLALFLALVPVTHADRTRTGRGTGCPGAGKAPRQLTAHQMRTAVLCMVNRLRRHYELRPLAYNEELRDSATAHSRDMVDHDYFSHDGADGSSLDARIARAGYSRRVNTYFVGENIGGGVGRRLGSPAAVCRAWMHSPSHRANILSPGFHDFGVGVARGFPGGIGGRAATYTLDFGAR